MSIPAVKPAPIYEFDTRAPFRDAFSSFIQYRVNGVDWYETNFGADSHTMLSIQTLVAMFTLNTAYPPVFDGWLGMLRAIEFVTVTFVGGFVLDVPATLTQLLPSESHSTLSTRTFFDQRPNTPSRNTVMGESESANFIFRTWTVSSCTD